MSEVARLRQQIEMELVAMRRGVYEFASGTARHDFIHARMDNVGEWQDRLADQVGSQAACQVVCELYVRAMESFEECTTLCEGAH